MFYWTSKSAIHLKKGVLIEKGALFKFWYECGCTLYRWTPHRSCRRLYPPCNEMPSHCWWRYDVTALRSNSWYTMADRLSTETKMSSFWWKFHHWLHRKLSFWQLSVQPVMKISSKWRHFRFSEAWLHVVVSILRPKQIGRHFADDILKCMFLHSTQTAMKVGLTLAPHRDGIIDVGPTLGQPTLLSG